MSNVKGGIFIFSVILYSYMIRGAEFRPHNPYQRREMWHPSQKEEDRFDFNAAFDQAATKNDRDPNNIAFSRKTKESGSFAEIQQMAA